MKWDALSKDSEPKVTKKKEKLPNDDWRSACANLTDRERDRERWRKIKLDREKEKEKLEQRGRKIKKEWER